MSNAARVAQSSTTDLSKIFSLFPDGAGWWRVRRADGLVFGIFFDRDSAVRFVHHQCRDAVIRTLHLV